MPRSQRVEAQRILAAGSRALKQWLTGAGAMEALLLAMARHREVAAVQENAAGRLSAVARRRRSHGGAAPGHGPAACSSLRAGECCGGAAESGRRLGGSEAEARQRRSHVPSYAYGHAYGYASGYAYGYAHGLVLATPTATPPATLAAAPTAALMATPAATPTATPTATLCGPRYDSEVRASEALEGIRAALALTVRAWGAVVSQGLAPVPALCLAVVSQCLAPVRAGGGGREPVSGSRPRARAV